jgi:hypothetical protein
MPVRSAPGGAVDPTTTVIIIIIIIIIVTVIIVTVTEAEAVEAFMVVLEEPTVAAVEVAATRRARSTITRTARTRVATV